MNSKKVCKLVNGIFAWVLKVEGLEVAFSSALAADYFAEHYKKLGYEIEWEKEEIDE